MEKKMLREIEEDDVESLAPSHPLPYNHPTIFNNYVALT